MKASAAALLVALVALSAINSVMASPTRELLEEDSDSEPSLKGRGSNAYFPILMSLAVVFAGMVSFGIVYLNWRGRPIAG